MKISIITVCFNAAATISDTIRSVAQQNYPDVEHIIVDGGSTDETLDIVRSHPSVSQFISEPDEGIYDAMNKGINLARGDVVGILNADDFYVSENVLSSVARIFQNGHVDACYADLVYVQQKNTDKVIRYWKSKKYSRGAFKKGWMPAHPTFFCRRSIYERHGLFDLGYQIAADVELLFRFLEMKQVEVYYLPQILTKMRLGGKTNQSFDNIRLQNKEILSFLDEHYGRVSRLIFFLGKLFNRTGQFLNKP